MVRKRTDSFRIAVDTLRAELRAGVHFAGARLTANDIAARLALSATPVREALSRLAGEGLLQERRGQGFFVPRLQEHDLVALFRLQLELLLIACEREPPPVSAADAGPQVTVASDTAPSPGSVLPDERLMRALAAGASPPLARHLVRLQDQLAPIRAAEGRVLGAPAGELERLAEAVSGRDPDRMRSALSDFFARRIAAAPKLARLHEAAKNIESI